MHIRVVGFQFCDTLCLVVVFCLGCDVSLGLLQHLLVQVVVGVVPLQDLPPQFFALSFSLPPHLLQLCVPLRNQLLQFFQSGCVHLCLPLHFLPVLLLQVLHFQTVGGCDALQLILESLLSQLQLKGVLLKLNVQLLSNLLDECLLICNFHVFIGVLALILDQLLVLSLPPLLVFPVSIVAFKQFLLVFTNNSLVRQLQLLFAGTTHVGMAVAGR